MDVASNKYCGMSQSSISKSINEVLSAFELSGLFKELVSFPSTFEELNEVRLKFMEVYRFPG